MMYCDRAMYCSPAGSWHPSEVAAALAERAPTLQAKHSVGRGHFMYSEDEGGRGRGRGHAAGRGGAGAGGDATEYYEFGSDTAFVELTPAELAAKVLAQGEGEPPLPPGHCAAWERAL